MGLPGGRAGPDQRPSRQPGRGAGAGGLGREVAGGVRRTVTAKGREKLEYGATSHSDPAYGNVPAGTGTYTQVYEETYTYDEVGNFLELDHAVPADTGESWTRTYDVATDSNRLQSTTVGGSTYEYEHDERGSITDMPHLNSIIRDFRDQIAKVVLNGGGDDALYLYDAAGQRVRKVVRRGANTETRSYIGGGAYEVYRKAVSGTQTVERQTLHVMDGSRRIAVVDTLTDHPTVTTPETVQRYQLDNHLGTACVEVNEDAEIISYEEYHPYGTTAWHASEGDVEVSLKRYRYTGMEKDEETGFACHGARYYLPWLGRWSSADPIGLTGGMNRYAYVHARPVGDSDRSGLKEPTYLNDAECGVENAIDMTHPGLPLSRTADGFVNSDTYDISRSIPTEKAWDPSRVLHVEYESGAVIEIDLFSELWQSQESIPGSSLIEAWSNGSLVDGIAFPAVLNEQTAPRLWAARQEALQALDEHNALQEGLIFSALATAYSSPLQLAPMPPVPARGYIGVSGRYGQPIEEPLIVGEYLAGKAPMQVTPGTRTVTGQYVNDRGRVEPWIAYYDEYGRLVGRTDFNAGNRAAGIPDVHYHTYEWGPGRTPLETQSHVPGEYKP